MESASTSQRNERERQPKFNRENPLSGEELEERLQAADDKRQKERDDRTEAKRQKKKQETGMDVSTQDIKDEEDFIDVENEAIPRRSTRAG